MRAGIRVDAGIPRARRKKHAIQAFRSARLGAEELERRGAAFDTVFGHEHASHFSRVELQAEIKSEGRGGKPWRKRPVRDPVSRTLHTLTARRCHEKAIPSNGNRERKRETSDSLDVATSAAFNLAEPRQSSEVDRPAAQLGQVAYP